MKAAGPADASADPQRIGSDIGGTFTDFAVLDAASGRIRIHKRLSTPKEPWRAVLEGVDVLEHGWPDGSQMLHATTLVTNSVIERRGARTGLLTTEGFRDVLELRRHMRTHVFDIYGDPAVPLVPRALRFELRERVFADGEVLVALDEDSLRDAVMRLCDAGVESVAVVLLHSYANPMHELAVRDIVTAMAPQLEVSLSHEVLPLLGEYERTSTTVLNAYSQPLVRGYVERLGQELGARGVDSMHLMASDASMVSAETAVDFPTRIIESGPAAGAVFARSVAAALGIEHIVSLDMGGTTAKVCLIDGGQLPLTSNLEVARDNQTMLDGFYRYRKGSGFPVGTPSVDLLEIGAGGGSIASVNSLGLLRIGPDSAGADPGPACYGRGGTEPTVTDANVVLGYIAPDSFLGGQMALDADGARRSIERRISGPLSLTLEEAAWRIHDVANEMMAAAIRRQMVENGRGEEAETLVAFGGAGPLHACHLAQKLGIRTVVIPPRAGVASAVGLLVAPVAFHAVQSRKAHPEDLVQLGLSDAFADLEQRALSRVRQVDPHGEIQLNRWLDMRYVGQGFELQVPLTQELSDGLSAGRIERAFNAAYEKRFGFHYDDVPMEIVNLRLAATVAGEEPIVALEAPSSEDARNATTVQFWNPTAGGYHEAPAVSRSSLPEGWSAVGPLVIREDESTTVVPQSATARRLPSGSLLITIDSGK